MSYWWFMPIETEKDLLSVQLKIENHQEDIESERDPEEAKSKVPKI